MSPCILRPFWVLAAFGLVMQTPLAADLLEDATEHFQRGRYEEAAEALAEASSDIETAADVLILHSRILEATGRSDEALKLLDDALQSDPERSELLARRAELLLLRGRLDQARESAEAAIAADKDSLPAHWVLANVYDRTGFLSEANVEYRWFVRYYNRVQPESAEELLWVARGAAEYARWHRVSQIFDFIVNTVCVDALKDDPHAWQAQQFSGQLLLEKYNRAEAMGEFQAALATNPRAVPAICSIGEAASHDADWATALEQADRALAINPEYVPARLLRAKSLFEAGQVLEARDELQRARQVDPTDERVAGALAACLMLTDEQRNAPGLQALLPKFGMAYEPDGERVPVESLAGRGQLTAELGELLEDVVQRNPHAGRFLTELGNWLESARRYPEAQAAFERAATIMPQLSEPQAQLAMLAMRMGELTAARELLDEAFTADPYHVRISNMRKVVDVVTEYEVISTDHFLVRYDPVADGVLGPYVSEYLESIHGELSERFQYEPPARTPFELFHNARGLPGQQWFAARMVGLPRIHTIGASTGMIVAMTSPTSLAQPVDWARILRHEYVHVLTLQKTDFRIPHWFTEALAVDAEGYAVPERWEQMLIARVASGDLRKLTQLNEGFIRAESSEDWNFNYYQSLLCLRFLRSRWGDESETRLLDAFCETATLSDALQRAIGVSVDEFEVAYRRYLEQTAAELQKRYLFAEPSVDDLRERYADQPKNAELAEELAVRLSLNGAEEEARELADELWSNGRRTARLACVLIDPEDADRTLALLSDVPDEERDFGPYLLRLAEAHLELSQFDAARTAAGRFTARFPQDVRGAKLAARIERAAGDENRERAALKRYLSLESDDAEAYLRTLELLAKQNEHADVIEYAKRALHLLPRSAEVHRRLATAYEQLDRLDEAAPARRLADQLERANGGEDK